MRYLNPTRWRDDGGWHVIFPTCKNCNKNGPKIKILSLRGICRACFNAEQLWFTSVPKPPSPTLKKKTSYGADKARLWRKKVREQVMAQYGGVCVCCGEDNIAFLAIDHILDDGKQERKALNVGGGYRFYRILLSRGCPKDRYQVLCHNCNWAKHIEGTCPHKKDLLTVS
jgi:hypothetical protein